jgi:hypothetical protein
LFVFCSLEKKTILDFIKKKLKKFVCDVFETGKAASVPCNESKTTKKNNKKVSFP